MARVAEIFSRRCIPLRRAVILAELCSHEVEHQGPEEHALFSTLCRALLDCPERTKARHVQAGTCIVTSVSSNPWTSFDLLEAAPLVSYNIVHKSLLPSNVVILGQPL